MSTHTIRFEFINGRAGTMASTRNVNVKLHFVISLYVTALSFLD